MDLTKRKVFKVLGIVIIIPLLIYILEVLVLYISLLLSSNETYMGSSSANDTSFDSKKMGVFIDYCKYEFSYLDSLSMKNYSPTIEEVYVEFSFRVNEYYEVVDIDSSQWNLVIVPKKGGEVYVSSVNNEDGKIVMLSTSKNHYSHGVYYSFSKMDELKNLLIDTVYFNVRDEKTYDVIGNLNVYR